MLPVVAVMAPTKTLAKKTKTISSVDEEDMSSKSKGGWSPVPNSTWEVLTAMEEDIKNLVVGGFLAPGSFRVTCMPLARMCRP
jgi:hypothetical protein